ncbi:MAG TPA: aspartyl protease family protein [Steroidobacteraceae bacterium]
MKTLLLRAICVVALLPGIALAGNPPASAAKPDPSDLLFASPTHMDRVGRIVAPVWINGKGPYRFLVDTGADGSLLSARLVRALGLLPNGTPDEQVQGTTGIEQLPCVTIADLRIGSIVKHNVRVPVSSSPVMTGLDGILGMAGFGPVRVMVDFQHNRVAIDRTSRALPSDFLDIPAERTSGGLLVIPAHVGGVAVEAVLDTGATETLGNAALRQALIRYAAKTATEARIYGVTKQISNGGISHSPTVYIGDAEIRNLGIVYSNIPIFRIWHLDSRPALIIGMNALGVVDALVLDYPSARVYLRPVPPQGLSVAMEDIFLPNGATNDIP